MFSLGKGLFNVFSHLLSIMYEHSDVDVNIICGDFNSRIGDLKDFVPSLDNITDRQCLDFLKASHYIDFIDFLMESKMCVVNDSVSSELQNFTSISKKGCSVIDYMCVRHSDLSNCICFTVHPVLNLVSQLNS